MARTTYADSEYDGMATVVGSAIEIRVGYAEGQESLLVGEITALKATLAHDGPALLTVQGFDRLHRLRRGRRTRAYSEVTDGQIAEAIASDMGLTPEVEDTGVVHAYVLQNNQSDVDFLRERARRIRYELSVDDRTLVFRPAANHLGSSVSLEYMTDLKSFEARLSTVAQTSEVFVRGFDPETKTAIVGAGRLGDETTKMGGRTLGPSLAEAAFGATTALIADVPVHSQSEADQVAKAKFNDLAIELIQAEVEAVGNPAIRAGSVIEVTGIGERFGGDYYVTTAEHRVGPELGYVTHARLRRNVA